MASPVIEPIARFGLAARGVVYVVIGYLSAKAAAGAGRATDKEGAVRAVERADTTGLLMIALGLGLLAYVAWRLAQAFADLEGKGNDARGLAVRAGYAASGLAYLGLAVASGGLGLAMGSDAEKRSWVARALAEPWGAWAVGLAGALIIGVGLYQFYKAWTAKFEKHLRFERIAANAEGWVRAIGRFGLSARGVTFLIIGWFAIEAARNLNAREIKDFGGALRTLQQQPYGAWLLGIVALGLISYGLLSFVDARYRRILRSY